MTQPGFDPSRRPIWQRLPWFVLPLVAFFLGCFELSDFDIWYHLRTGELIPRLGVPEKDWYSYRSADEEWIDVHWGFQRIVAEIYGRFGSAGLVIMKSTLAALVMAISLTAYRPSWPTFVPVLVWTPFLLLMSSRFYERPEMFTMLFTAIFLTVLFHAEDRPRWLWLLPVIQVVWANIQGLFVFGPIILGMYWAEAVLRVDRVRGLFRHLMPVTLLVFAACIASPYTWRNLLLVAQISQTATTSMYKDSIAELRSVPAVIREGGATDPFVILLAACGFVAVVSVVAGIRIILRERRLFRILPVMAFGYLGLQAIRNGNHCALVLGTVTCWNLGSLHWRNRPAWRGLVILTAWVLGLLFFIVTERWNLLAAPSRAIGLGERPNYYAREALQLAGRQGMPHRVFVMHNGHAALYEYLNFSPESGRRTFADARLEVHSQQTYKLYLDITQSFREDMGQWDTVLRQDGVDLIAADGDQYPEAQAALLVHPEWTCIWYDEVIAVFLRKTITLPEGILPWSIHQELFRQPRNLVDCSISVGSPRFLWRPPENYRKGKDDFLAVRSGSVWDRLSKRSSASPELVRAWNTLSFQAARRAVERRPWAPDGWRALGYAAIGSVKAGQTLEHPISVPDVTLLALASQALRNTIRLAPNDFYAHFWLGQVYQSMGAWDAAKPLLEAVSVLTPLDRQQVKMLASEGPLRSMLADVRLKHNSAEDRTPSGSDPLTMLKNGLVLRALQTPPSGAWTEHRRADFQLIFGEIETARNLYVKANKSALGNALCDLVLGNWAQAEHHFLIMSRTADASQARWGLAWLSLMTSQRDKCLEHIEAGLAAHPDPLMEQRLKQLRDLVLVTSTKP